MQKLNVLDKGFVRIVDHMGNDLSVVRSARISYDAAWRAGENEQNDNKLIKYLWKNKHTTPFESVTFTFEIKAPIFVFRQWHRHRTWSYNELSGRYKELQKEFYIPDPQNIGKQSTYNKQGREPMKRDILVPSMINYACNSMWEVYLNLLKQDVPKELARIVLPLNIYSHMFATVNLLNLFKFIDLRSHPHAQWEIQQYAKALKELITPIVPTCMEAYSSETIKGDFK